MDSEEVLGADVIETVKTAHKIGQAQYVQFVKERFKDRSKAITDPIHKNKLPLMSRKNVQKKKSKLASLKDDCSLFSRLYIACQSRQGDLQTFFEHENQPWPPALCKAGKIRSGCKSDLLHLV